MGPFSGSASSTSKWPCSGNVSTCPRGRMRTCSTKLWRWLPEDLGSFYVTVNVPEFMLRVMAEGNPIFTARVVVGGPDTQTPIFSQEMQEIVFNPYWSVPNSIKTEEILPYIQRTGGNSFFGGSS